jgi:glutamyl-tRNA synthetase
MVKDIRVRFAPSPTGALHLGNVRAAVFNWLFAKKANGSFVLRIEDTDAARSTKESEDEILKNLAWVGITCDEGPAAGGPYAPYRQSERKSIYEEHLKKLIEQKKAYRCYCSKEELDYQRKIQARKSLMPSYTGKCRNLTAEKEEEFTSQGRKPVIRLLIKDKTVTFNDLVKGGISYNTNSLGGDFIIVRSNSGFVYNFTVVIDDALMKISHVIRGEDHLTNTIKQLILYEALGFSPPEFAHCPLILGEDGKKLSKRSLALNSTGPSIDTDSLSGFRENGILPDPLINYIALLGWSSKDGTEIFSIEELINKFDLKNVSKSPSVFSYDKLKWVNGEHIKKMDDETFTDRLFDYLKVFHDKPIKENYLISLDEIDKRRFFEFARLIKENIVILKDALFYLKISFCPEIKPSDEAVKILEQNGAADVVQSFLEHLKKEALLDRQIYQKITDNIKGTLNVKGRGLFMPLRAAITGNAKGPHLDDLCAFLGRDTVIKRMSGTYK